MVETFISEGRSIAVETFLPPSPGRHPATLILHGAFGLLPEFRSDIVSFAVALVSLGHVAVLPHYLDRTGTAAGPDALATNAAHLLAWKAACRDALLFMRSQPRVDAGRLGLLGFSLGGHLGLDLAMSPHVGPRVKCVVNFFAPTRAPLLRGDRALLPPVLIQHGTSDSVVPIEDSVSLVADLRAAGKVEGLGYRFLRYPGEGHGFIGEALDASRRATTSFVKEIV
jgi:dienelactone hydrolase